MLDQVKQLLENAPIDMSPVLQMPNTAAGNRNAFLIAGSANAHVLTLLDGIGLGQALFVVQQPCVVICEKSESLSIVLHSNEGSLKCSSMEDLAERLKWPENSGALVQIGCPGDLLGKSRLIFAILDSKNYQKQLDTYALGCCGAMIVIDAVDAPPVEVYHFARWLAQVAASVLVLGNIDVPNCDPAMVMAVQMGVRDLPVITCNTAKESIAEKMASGMARTTATSDSEGLAREMARNALQRLAQEKERLTRSMDAPVQPKLSLEERFRAQVPGTRLRMEKLISAEQGNRLYADVHNFAIYLQTQMEKELLAAIPELKQPKEDMQLFAQGYLSHVLSDYCEALLGDMVQQEILPQLQKNYREMLDEAWIRQAIEEGQLPVSALEHVDLAVQRVDLGTDWVVNAAVNVIVKTLLDVLAPEFRYLSRSITKTLMPLVKEGMFKLISPAIYARQQAKMLSKMLDVETGKYQTLVQDTMLPQIQSKILDWFDDHVERIAEALRAEDQKTAEMNDSKTRSNQKAAEMIRKIAETEKALQEFA